MNVSIGIIVNSKLAEKNLRRVQREFEKLLKLTRQIQKSMGLGFGGAVTKEAKQLSKSVQTIQKDLKGVSNTTKQISKTTVTGFKNMQTAVEKTQKSVVSLGWGFKDVLKDAVSLANFQARWYLARAAVFAVPRAIKSGIAFEAEIDKAEAQLLRYEAMEGEITAIHKKTVEEMILYSRQLAVNLPVTFEEIIKAADRLRAAGADIDTVKGSLESFAKLEVAFPEIEMEKFTTAIIGFLNTFRKTPGLREFENDAQRLQAILDKVTMALAKGVIAPKDINVLIQHLGQMSQAAGFSIDQMLGLSVMVTNLGMKAGLAGRALRGLLDSLSSPKGIESLEKIGIQLDKNKTIASQFKDIIEGLRKAVGTGELGLTLESMEFLRGIAATQRRPALLALIREFEEYNALVISIEGSTGALNRTSAIMTDTLSGQGAILKNITKELGAALSNSDLLREGLGLLIDILKGLGFMLSGIAGVTSLVIDTFEFLYHVLKIIINPVERMIQAFILLSQRDFSGAKRAMQEVGKVFEAEMLEANDVLQGAFDRAFAETMRIQNVLFGKSKFTGGKDEISATTAELKNLGLEAKITADEVKRLASAMDNFRVRIIGLNPELDQTDKRILALRKEAEKLMKMPGANKKEIENLLKGGIQFINEADLKKQTLSFKKFWSNVEIATKKGLEKELALVSKWVKENVEKYKKNEEMVLAIVAEGERRKLEKIKEVAEKNLEAYKKYEGMILKATATELEKKLTAQDLWLDKVKETLEKAGLAEEEYRAEMIKATRIAQEKKAELMAGANLTFADGWKQAMQDYVDSAQFGFDRGKEMADEAARTMGSFFEDVFLGKIKLSFKNAFDTIAGLFVKLLAQMASAAAMKRIMPNLASFIPGMGGQGWGWTNMFTGALKNYFGGQGGGGWWGKLKSYFGGGSGYGYSGLGTNTGALSWTQSGYGSYGPQGSGSFGSFGKGGGGLGWSTVGWAGVFSALAMVYSGWKGMKADKKQWKKEPKFKIGFGYDLDDWKEAREAFYEYMQDEDGERPDEDTMGWAKFKEGKIDQYGDWLMGAMGKDWDLSEKAREGMANIFKDVRKALEDFIPIIGGDLSKLDEKWSSSFLYAGESGNPIEAALEEYLKFVTDIDFTQFQKSGEEFVATVERIISAVVAFPKEIESIADTIDMIMGDYDPVKGWRDQLELAVGNLYKLKDALEDATDPADAMEFAVQLKQGIYETYLMAKEFVENFVTAIVNAELEMGQFAFNLQSKIDAFTGSALASGIAMQNMSDILVKFNAAIAAGNTTQAMTYLTAGIGSIDQWLAARISEIQRKYAGRSSGGGGPSKALQNELTIQQKQLEIIKGWASLLDSIEQTIFDLQTSAANPQDIFDHLGIAKAEMDRIRELYEGATGEDRLKYAQELQELLKTYLSLGGEAFQRPSGEYQAIYDEVIAGLKFIQEDAASYAALEEDIQKEILNLQAQIAASSARTSNHSAAMQAEIEAVQKEAAEYYQFAMDEGLDLYLDSIEDMKDNLSELLGDKTAEEYLADLQLAATLELVRIRDLLTDVFTQAFPEIEVPAFGHGGYVDRPTLAMVGERGPEYIVPAGKMPKGDTYLTVSPQITITADRNADASSIARTVEDVIVDSVINGRVGQVVMEKVKYA